MNNSSLYRKTRNTLFLVMLVLAVVLVIQIVLNVLVIPRMKIRQVLLESTLQLPDQTLLRMGGIQGQVNYLTLDEDIVQASYESSPLIRKAFVEKQFPNTLKIVLYGRNPLGMFLKVQDNTALPVVFDDQGVLFHAGHAGEGLDLPVLTGSEFSEMEVGMTLPEGLMPLLEDLKMLQMDNPLLFSGISEISVREKGEGLYDFTLYFKSFAIPVLVSENLDEQLLKKAMLVLDVMKKRAMLSDVEYADFRSGQVILKMREGV